MARILVISAGGFKGFKTPSAEIKAIRDRRWYPRSPDFEETARLTRGAKHYGADTPGKFFGVLSIVKNEKRIVFIGHGGRDSIGLAGDLSYSFTKEIGVTELEKWKTTIASIRPKIKNARLDLFTCYSGVEKSVAQSMATAFGIEVRAYGGPVTWYIGEDGKQITSRGLICSDRQCQGKKYKGVHKLRPPNSFSP